MISDITINKQLLDLTNLKLILTTQDVDSVLLEPSEINVLPTLIIPLEIEETLKSVHYSATFIPMDPEFIEYSSLLQLYWIHDLKANETNELELRKFLGDLNLLTSAGSFGLNSDGEIYFRYVSMQDQFVVLNENTVLETLMLFESNINSFLEFIHSVNDGKMTCPEAVVAIKKSN